MRLFTLLAVVSMLVAAQTMPGAAFNPCNPEVNKCE
mgnify:CR=1 FL=1